MSKIRTVVVSGFPGVGKSHFFRGAGALVVLDSDSSQFSWVSEGVRNSAFPQNYISHIKANIGKAHLILVSSHKVVRDALRENGIEYISVYPDVSLKCEYIERYKQRGSSQAFVDMMEQNFEAFVAEIVAETFPRKRALAPGEHLSDVIPEYVYGVMCEGACNSHHDDHCGMHLNIEPCPACESLKVQATEGEPT